MKCILSAVVALAIVQGILCSPENPPPSLLVHTVSWHNDFGEAPDDLNEFVGLTEANEPDLISVAVQGYGFKVENLGHSCTKNFNKTLNSKYFKLLVVLRNTSALAVYVNHKHKDQTSAVKSNLDVVTDVCHTTIEFYMYDKKFTFATAKMSDAHCKNNQFDYLSNVNSPPSDFHFFTGDLNSTVEEKTFEEAKKLVDENKLEELKKFDQLYRANSSLPGWVEPTSNFKPTYKFTPKTEEYVQSVVPSWPDRALFKKNEANTVEKVDYKSLTKYRQTDHIPVVALYKVKLSY